MRIKKGDIIKMLSGKDKGKTGKVLRVFLEEKKITAEGLNIIKKHTRPRKEGEKGQRVELPRKVSVSNAQLVCPKCSKTARIGYKKIGESKSRFCKRCKADI
jgi:large subunit ribosomal protein L24